MRLASVALVGCALAASWLAVACGSSNGSSPKEPGDDAGMTVETSVAQDTGSPVVVDSGSTAVDAPADAGPAGEAGFPAFLPDDVPQVVDSGGPVMTAPKVVPIFYAVDDPTTVASLEDFITKLPGSSYWQGWAPEYGVGDITALAPIVLTDSLTAYWDDSQIQADLTAKLEANDPAFPAPDGNTIYAFFFPPGVTITTDGVVLGDGGPDAAAPNPSEASCTGFGGYHDNITLSNNMNVAYAVVPRCASFGILSGLDAITGPASHELAEAASDPFPSSDPAYLSVDAPHRYWTRLLGGGEIGDMCAQEEMSSFVKFPPGVPYTVQRIWSNHAAMAGTDPCVPLPAGDLYATAYPVLPDMITSTSHGSSVTSKGVSIPVGGSATVEFDLVANSAAVGPFTVKLIDSSSSGNEYLSVAWVECNGSDACTGSNGDKLHAIITVSAAGRGGTEPFLVESLVAQTGVYQFWAGLVGQPSDAGAPGDSGGG